MDIKNRMARCKLSDDIIQNVTSFLNKWNTVSEFLEQYEPDLYAQFTERIDSALNGIDRNEWSYEGYLFTDDMLNMLQGLDAELAQIEEELSGIQRYRG